MPFSPEEHEAEMQSRRERAFNLASLENSVYRNEILGLAKDIKDALGIEVDLFFLLYVMEQVYEMQFTYERQNGSLCTHIQIPVKDRSEETQWLDIVETPNTTELTITQIQTPEGAVAPIFVA